MNDTIHINLGIHATDTHNIGTYTVRIWANLLASINWIYKNPIPGTFLIQHGISMTLVNNMAMALEGFIADICWDYAQSKDQLKPLVSNIDRMTWQGKKELYNNLFTKKMEDYFGFDGISALIKFRNNLAHGRTYTEITKREISGGVASDMASDIETENKTYQDLRDYLIGNNILKSRNTSSNFEVPWKIEVANHFVGLAKHFMENILKENESDSKLGIEMEFKLANNSK
jgi:hypothetical protein